MLAAAMQVEKHLPPALDETKVNKTCPNMLLVNVKQRK